LIADLELVDYKVRILNGGTEAVTRVLIESTDEAGNRWTHIGVSPNIVDASFEALIDSKQYLQAREAWGRYPRCRRRPDKEERPRVRDGGIRFGSYDRSDRSEESRIR
jgi:hypothetical protein